MSTPLYRAKSARRTSPSILEEQNLYLVAALSQNERKGGLMHSTHARTAGHNRPLERLRLLAHSPFFSAHRQPCCLCSRCTFVPWWPPPPSGRTARFAARQTEWRTKCGHTTLNAACAASYSRNGVRLTASFGDYYTTDKVHPIELVEQPGSTASPAIWLQRSDYHLLSDYNVIVR